VWIFEAEKPGGFIGKDLELTMSVLSFKVDQEFLASLKISSKFHHHRLPLLQYLSLMNSGIDVLIIGGGVAGLTAANILKAADLTVHILEARSRLGGRVWTLKTPQSVVPIELGAEFIHGTGNQVTSWLKKFNEASYSIFDRHMVYDNSKLLSKKDFWQDLYRVMKNLRSSDESDRSFREYLNTQKGLSHTQKAMALSFIEGFHAANPQKISEHSLKIAEGSTQEDTASKTQRLIQGYGSLISNLESKVADNVSLNSQVKEIYWSKGSVEVWTDDVRWKARQAIITVPVGIIKDISFNPALWRHEKAAEMLPMGSVLKLVFEFKEKFWKDDVDFYHAPEKLFHTWWSTQPVQSNILVAWVGGPTAERMAKFSDSHLLEIALNETAEIFHRSKSEIVNNLMTCHYHNWQTDQFSQGAYCYIRKGGLPAQKFFAAPVEDTLYFAGEAYFEKGETGMVESAMESASTVANQILQSYPTAQKRKRALREFQEGLSL
jgi:monoamine oxidase